MVSQVTGSVAQVAQADCHVASHVDRTGRTGQSMTMTVIGQGQDRIVDDNDRDRDNDGQ